MKLFRLFRLAFYALFITAMGFAYFVYVQTLSKPLQNRHVSLQIPQGVGVSWLANHLQEQGVIDNKYVLRAYIWLNNPDLSIKAGDYTLVDVDNIPDLVNKVGQGKVIQYAITLIEGKTFAEYLALLTSQKKLANKLDGMSNAQIMRALGSPGKHPEGLFAPQTYFYQKGDSDLDVLKQSFQQQQAILKQAWQQRSPSVKVNTAYELLILASIIEKETGQASEREKIAGVFNNRLKLGMKLQTDPTVIYGMGKQYKGNIRRKDLTTDTPYNTYTRFGLPPTPIAMPGEAAIKAAANPVQTKALYFVGKGDGTHQFSNNLRAHNQAVVKYQLHGKRKPFSSSSENSSSEKN